MLNVVSAGDAMRIISENIPDIKRTETAALEAALGRVCAEDICSGEDLPAFARSTVDGYAVIAGDTYGCSESIPAMLTCDGEIKMGERPCAPLSKGHCIRISTGGGLPEGADAVSMIEYTDDLGDELRYIYKPVAVLENVNNKGDDVKKGSIVLKKGDVITSGTIAVLAALGISEIPVAAQVKAGIISTGNELVEYDTKPEGNQIRNINSIMLAAQIRELGAVPVVYPIVKDEIPLLKAALENALESCDVVFISGGSSVGEKDNTFNVLNDLGTVYFHGISVKPGKPTIFAAVHEKPVFGLPGHPQAAFFVFTLFAAPALLKMSMKASAPVSVRKILSANVPSNHGREEIIPVVISGRYAKPLHSKSGVVSVLSRADGYIRIDRNAEGLEKDTLTDVFLLHGSSPACFAELP